MVNKKIKGYINKNKRGNTHVLPDMIHTFFFLKNEGKFLKIYIYETKTVKISICQNVHKQLISLTNILITTLLDRLQ